MASSRGHFSFLFMKTFICIFIAFFLLTSCGRNSKKIIGVECFNTDKKQTFKQITNQNLIHYNTLKDSIFNLPHAPLHKVLSSPNYKTYVGMYYKVSVNAVQDSLSNSAFLIKQRKDTLGYHYLLNNKNRAAYAFLKPSEKASPLIFLKISNDKHILEQLYARENYYAEKLRCKE